MKYLLIKNKKLYKLFFKIELKRLMYKGVFYNCNLPPYIRQFAAKRLFALKGPSYVRIKQRCLSTNNSRSVFNFFKLSRIKLRLLASNNFINGIKKSS